ncbi:tetratricopeptide repeat protein [Moritella sp. F3]|uniref:tetratricopeptide repeat protein n=1 Tax=Moritella sp. F3 TaxID=2718882 RepID=UPI0018E138B8|nr:tetratricopeptide repeat protein [Moritella sp. F3]GIC77982.1 co-chaperone YbbN [Moritella sp. F1]GIC82616.1 co-chaperone YbbN [Moritella sp. F3]
MQNYILDLTSENFQEILLQGKYSQPIVIDFWSERAPENQVSARLLNIAQSFNGEIVLARLNCDRHPELAQQFGIKSLPTVAIFKDGKPVDSFVGEQEEAAIREIISRHLPKQEQVLLQQAQMLLMDSKFAEAVPLIGQAYELAPDNTDIKIAYAQALLGSHQVEAAEALLDTFAEEEQQSHQYQTLRSHLDTAKKSAETPEIVALTAAHQANPDDLQIAYDLAIQLQIVNKHNDAMALLYKILTTEYDFLEGGARKIYLELLSVMTDAAVVADYRRKLYTLMY